MEDSRRMGSTLDITMWVSEILAMEDSRRMGSTLDITIHHARNIHNICIYGDQDVYAKFSLINYGEVPALITEPVKGGGKSPAFNQSFHMHVPAPDAVLKCEIWMMSCVRNYLEDQLLGFALVPLIEIGQERLTKDYMLTSTELFHAPAGIIRLSLSLRPHSLLCEEGFLCNEFRAKSDLVDFGEHNFSPVDYRKVEFPDLNAASETQHLISAFNMGLSAEEDSNLTNLSACSATNAGTAEHTSSDSSTDKEMTDEKGTAIKEERSVELLPSVTIALQPQEPIVQQQIVDMYMKSMQDFTESLAKMKLPLDLDIHNQAESVTGNVDAQTSDIGKKGGNRVFYGSRAFF